MTMPKRLTPVHPGEVLREEFMEPLGTSINALARELHVPVSRISKIVNEERSISAETAIRLARYFGMSSEFWMNLQSRYDLRVAHQQGSEMVQREVHPRELARSTPTMGHK
jgi:addiction module HigA family antidote